MTKCHACGAARVERTVLPTHEDTLLGAPFAIILENAVAEESCATCGHRIGLLYPNLSGMIAAVAMARALYPEKLCPAEVRFLRKAMGWRQKELAKKLHKTVETVSRWESGGLPMALDAEKHLRLHVCFALAEHAPLVDFEPEQILELQIRPMRLVGSRLEMRCRPVTLNLADLHPQPANISLGELSRDREKWNAAFRHQQSPAAA